MLRAAAPATAGPGTKFRLARPLPAAAGCQSMSGTLLQAWKRTLRQDPAAPAVIDAPSGKVWSRAEIARAAADWLAQFDRPERLRGRRVAVTEPNGSAWWIVFLGLLEARAIPALLDPTEPPATQRQIAEAIGAGWLCRAGRLEPVAPDRFVRRSDACLVKLTSGSTGVPGARLFTHDQMLADGRQVCTSMDIRPNDVNLAVIPLGHSYALGNIVVPLLAQGTAAVCAGSPLPHVLAADTARWRPTVFPAVPTLLRALVRAEVGAADLASVRLTISAGAPLDPDIAAAFAHKFGRRVHGFYGTSETGGISFDATGEATLSGRSVGRPLAGVSLEFLRGRRFRVRSAAVSGRGFHQPADRGCLNEHGELVLLGRTGRTIKIAGRRLDLGEIEAALRALPGVQDAFAAALDHRADALAVAVCTDRPVAGLKAELRSRLAPWKVPDRWIALREFPLTARGKIDTRALRLLLANA